MSERKLTIIFRDRAGGIPNVFRNLLLHLPAGLFDIRIVLLDKIEYSGPRVENVFQHAHISRFSYSKYDNQMVVLRRLGKLFTRFESVLITNSEMELQAISHAKINRPIIHIVHGNNPKVLQTACAYERIVDVFISVSLYVRDALRRLLPHRANHIRQILHPISVKGPQRQPDKGPLRCVYVGRLVPWKGIQRLPEIDRKIREKGVQVRWTIIGSGPLDDKVRRCFDSAAVTHFTGELSNDAVLKYFRKSDILVSPSELEGFPMVLAEAALMGVVPVFSDLPSGIPEMIENGITGFRCHYEDTNSMAAQIVALSRNRPQLEKMSSACRKKASAMFNPDVRALEYSKIFEEISESSKKKILFPAVTSPGFLDRRFLPNFFVRNLRLLARSLH